MWSSRLFLLVVHFLLVGVVLSEEEEEESHSDYDDKDVQFEASPPNLLILLADPKNGSTVPLANQANTLVVLDRSFEKVHLFCSAYYPIKWTYFGDGVIQLNYNK
jgi:hypothetical protein